MVATRRAAPIPWAPPSEAGAGAGFTSALPWLPITPEAETVAVSRQRRDPASTLSFYRRLLSVRASAEALRAGSYRALAAGEDVFAYLREYGSERILVALNFAPTRQTLVGLPPGLDRDEVGVLCSTHRSGRIRLAGVELAANEALVVRA